ncbi:MGMT family protein [Enterococcus sp. AZ109]|uniref:MGMT family protein n=1 Tax=Enterococcus sp. AZ109 TaxID=2774634 RepID=UPI003F207F54
MANEAKKDFNAMLLDNKDMPKTQRVTDPKTIARYGGDKMFFAPPLAYDEIMKRVPEGKVLTVNEIRNYLAMKNGADFTEPMTAGIFISIVAWAAEQRSTNPTPYWRTLKTNGELNPKYPGGIEAQKAKLEKEGHTIVQRGRKNLRYYVEDVQKVLYALDKN